MTLLQLNYMITIANSGSINEAAKKLFLSQPSLTAALQSVEKELGFSVFNRTKSGVSLTTEGAEFIGYAKSVTEQYALLDAKYISKSNIKRKFSVSMQHYTFAVNAFVETVKRFGMDMYEFEVHETKTYEVIEDVKNLRSEIGILYQNEYNRDVLTKLFKESGIIFTPLFDCGIYVYIHKNHPLASQEMITMEQLEDFPCLGFDQGSHNSFYFSEEVMSTHPYKRFIRANDRATLLNLMVGLNGFTLCSGIICEDLNGSDYLAVKLDTREVMTIGYISRKDSSLSEIGKVYLEELKKYEDYILEI